MQCSRLDSFLLHDQSFCDLLDWTWWPLGGWRPWVRNLWLHKHWIPVTLSAIRESTHCLQIKTHSALMFEFFSPCLVLDIKMETSSGDTAGCFLMSCWQDEPSFACPERKLWQIIGSFHSWDVFSGLRHWINELTIAISWVRPAETDDTLQK